MAISVFRRPPVTLSRFAASARFRNVGAEVITPNEASAMPPDLMKYLRFIVMFVYLLFTCHLSLVTVFETPATQESSRQSSPPDCRSSLDSHWRAAVAGHPRL